MRSTVLHSRRGRAWGAFALVLTVIIIGAGLAIWFILRERAGGGFYVEGPPRARPEEISRAVTKVAPAVVRMDTTVAGGPNLLQGLFGAGPENIFPEHGIASGIIINGRRGYVLTNAHVVRDARQIKVNLADGREFAGKMVGADPVTDVALVQVNGTNLPEAELGSSDRLPVGSWVVAVGNPYGLDYTVTAGVVSAKGRTMTSESGIAITDLLQTDAAINPGNSGGALIDLKGHVVGMPTAIVRSAQGIGFAVAIDTAKDIIPQLARTGKVSHAWLGIRYATRFSDGAIVIERVLPGTPAAQAGLRRGDVIRSVAGDKVGSADDVARILRRMQPGQELRLTVQRQGKKLTVTARLAQMPRLK